MFSSAFRTRQPDYATQKTLLGTSCKRLVRVTTLIAALSAVVYAATVPDAVATYTYSTNMRPLGHSARNVPLENGSPGAGIYNSDLAFWGRTAYQGHFSGFRIIDITNPENPIELNNYEDCSPGTTQGNQGDVSVWGNILVRSWNSPATAISSCDGELVGAGFEGVHIFDVSNPSDPDLLAAVPLSGGLPFGCGSHTSTTVPDLVNNRLLVYSSPGPQSCFFFDIIEIPLDNPGSANKVRSVYSLHGCHDLGVILGSANRLACAGGKGVRIFSLDPVDGASLDNPVLTLHFEIPGVTIGHSASWSWDGEVLIFGHEPGGGTQARCQETSALVDRTLYFYDPEGNQLGTFVHPRPQTNLENCAWHNYNVVPTDRGRFLVSGNYQSGISVVDFTDPANAFEIAHADPAPLIDPDPPGGIEVGGGWSSYWYNGLIYESDMTRGLTIWRLVDNAGVIAGAGRLDHLNPQTQEFTIPLRIR